MHSALGTKNCFMEPVGKILKKNIELLFSKTENLLLNMSWEYQKYVIKQKNNRLWKPEPFFIIATNLTRIIKENNHFLCMFNPLKFH